MTHDFSKPNLYKVFKTPFWPAQWKVGRWEDDDNATCNFFREQKDAMMEAAIRNMPLLAQKEDAPMPRVTTLFQPPIESEARRTKMDWKEKAIKEELERVEMQEQKRKESIESRRKRFLVELDTILAVPEYNIDPNDDWTVVISDGVKFAPAYSEFGAIIGLQILGTCPICTKDIRSHIIYTNKDLGTYLADLDNSWLYHDCKPESRDEEESQKKEEPSKYRLIIGHHPDSFVREIERMEESYLMIMSTFRFTESEEGRTFVVLCERIVL